MKRLLAIMFLGLGNFAGVAYASQEDAQHSDECNSEFVAPDDYVYQFSGSDCTGGQDQNSDEEDNDADSTE